MVPSRSEAGLSIYRRRILLRWNHLRALWAPFRRAWRPRLRAQASFLRVKDSRVRVVSAVPPDEVVARTHGGAVPSREETARTSRWSGAVASGGSAYESVASNFRTEKLRVRIVGAARACGKVAPTGGGGVSSRGGAARTVRRSGCSKRRDRGLAVEGSSPIGVARTPIRLPPPKAQSRLDKRCRDRLPRSSRAPLGALVFRDRAPGARVGASRRRSRCKERHRRWNATAPPTPRP